MIEIRGAKKTQLDAFLKVVTENEGAIGALMERIRVIQGDPSQHNVAGAAKIRSLMLETLTHSKMVDEAYHNL